MKDLNCNSLRNLATKILLGFLGAGVISIKPCFAQSVITPDNTLGTEASRVTPNVNNPDGIPSELIEGGAQRGQNLFHSFQEFNVNEGRGAYFLVPNDTIQNVLARVTGNNRSEILGILGTTSNRNFAPTNVNLFLINPNGIVFGQNASLDVNGSFVGTSANAVEFGEGFFSATNPQAPSGLLTVDPSAFLFNQINAQASIQNNSVADVGLDPSDEFTFRGLRVPDGKSLLLVGGDINMNGGGLIALGGRIELGSLASAGTVGLNGDGNNLSLSFPDSVERSDISLSNDAGVRVIASDGGSIAVNARNLQMTGDSGLFAGIESGLGDEQSQVGNIDINATEMAIADSSKIYNEVAQNAVGNSGNININADSLSLGNKSFLATSTNGKGNAGNVTINTGSLSVVKDSLLAANANGQGNAGNINIYARDFILFDRGWAFTDIGENGKGQAGNFNITTPSLSLTNDAKLIASTKNQGNAGNITINTGSLSVSDNSFLAASANGQQGNAGNINIHARDRVLFDRAGKVYTDVTTKGNGGNISITTDSLSVTNSSRLDGGTSGVGDAGNITFNTNSFSVTNNSRVIASTSGVGDAGNINLITDSLFVTNNSELAASANGRGNAGNIDIHARTVSFDYGSQVYTDVNQLPFNDGTQVKGNGGDINITSESLSLTNGSQLISNTQGEGNAGDINIDTGSLFVTDKSFLASSANGQGDAGDITINARDRVLFNQGSAFSNVDDCSSIAVGCTPSNNTIQGNGGSITIKAPSLQLINDSFLATGVGNDLFGKKVEGNAGNISIHLRDDLSLDQSFITSRLFTNGKGKAGDIDIRAGSVSSDQSLISASTQGQGNAGGVSLQATGAISLVDSEISTAIQKGATGDAQGINIIARSLFLSDGAQLNAVTSGEGKAGNILVNTTDKISVSGTNTTAVPTNLFQSNIPPRFNSPPKFLDRVSSGIFTSAEPNSTGNAGDLTINTSQLQVLDGAIVSASTDSQGKGGDLTVKTDSLQLKDNGIITTESGGTGTAGNINLNIQNNFNADNGQVLTQAQQSSGGDIHITAGKNIFLRNNSDIKTILSTTKGSGGDITLKANAIVALEGSDLLAFAPEGTGGNITFDTRAFFSNPIFRLTSQTADRASLDALDTNNRVDVNASGRILPGTISGIPDLSLFQNSLIELPQNLIDTAALVASSCVVRSNKRNGTFFITGKAGLPIRPGDAVASVYSAVDVQAVPDDTSATKHNHRWKIGDPIVEPTGVYRLENGQRILSRECRR